MVRHIVRDPEMQEVQLSSITSLVLTDHGDGHGIRNNQGQFVKFRLTKYPIGSSILGMFVENQE